MTTQELSGRVQDEGAAMRKGRIGPLVALTVLAVAVLGGLLFLMGGDDDRRVHRELGRKINGVKLDGFDSFWSCAVIGTDYRLLKSNADLAFELTRRVEQVGAPYATHLEDECMPSLAKVAPTLESLIVHNDDLQGEVARMGEAARALEAAMDALIGAIADAEGPVDPTLLPGHMQTITRSWYDFRRAYGDANRLLKQRLD